MSRIKKIKLQISLETVSDVKLKMNNFDILTLEELFTRSVSFKVNEIVGRSVSEFSTKTPFNLSMRDFLSDCLVKVNVIEVDLENQK